MRKYIMKTALTYALCLGILISLAPCIAAAATGNDQVYQIVQAFDDYYVGKAGMEYKLRAGQTAYLDDDDNVIKILDAQERVIMENLGKDGYRYYAYEDIDDSNIAGGCLLLKAGHSYTFDKIPTLAKIQAEVRVTETGELIGYALLNATYDSNGAFLGLEVPLASVDTNGDGLIGIDELNASLELLSENVSEHSASHPSLAKKLETDIASAYDAIDNGDCADAYAIVVQVQTDSQTFTQIPEETVREEAVQQETGQQEAVQEEAGQAEAIQDDTPAQTAAEEADGSRIIWIVAGAALAVVVLLLAVFLLLRRRSKITKSQQRP